MKTLSSEPLCSCRFEWTDCVFCALSVVSRFLELLSAQVLQSSGDAPIGLQFHILDLYMSELAAVGSAEVRHCCSQDFLESAFNDRRVGSGCNLWL